LLGLTAQDPCGTAVAGSGRIAFVRPARGRRPGGAGRIRPQPWSAAVADGATPCHVRDRRRFGPVPFLGVPGRRGRRSRRRVQEIGEDAW